MYIKVKIETTDERNETVHLFDYNITRWVNFYIICLLSYFLLIVSIFHFQLILIFIQFSILNNFALCIQFCISIHLPFHIFVH